jgi:hypothetical protein
MILLYTSTLILIKTFILSFVRYVCAFSVVFDNVDTSIGLNEIQQKTH